MQFFSADRENNKKVFVLFGFSSGAHSRGCNVVTSLAHGLAQLRQLCSLVGGELGVRGLAYEQLRALCGGGGGGPCRRGERALGCGRGAARVRLAQRLPCVAIPRTHGVLFHLGTNGLQLRDGEAVTVRPNSLQVVENHLATTCGRAPHARCASPPRRGPWRQLPCSPARQGRGSALELHPRVPRCRGGATRLDSQVRSDRFLLWVSLLQR
jgi:hypothetical protein